MSELKKPTVWWVQCKPFPPELRDSDECQEFQKECYNDKFFGMGWRWDDFKRYEGQTFTWEIANSLRDIITKNKSSARAFSAAQNKYARMCPGDIVLTKLQDNYYAGIISFSPKISTHARLSWYSEVEEWKRLGKSTELPHHVRGKLSSQKYHGTVAEIDGLSAYTILEKVGVKIPEKPMLNATSFVEALGDEDLEDLMAHYMIFQKPGYVFLPSSCKKNTPEIEYVMYDPETDETICCQTKINRNRRWHICRESIQRLQKNISVLSKRLFRYETTRQRHHRFKRRVVSSF